MLESRLNRPHNRPAIRFDYPTGQTMYLQEVYVTNFRSISSVTLKPCGSFNVLIGKNNSGKSNLLESIEVLFKYISQDIVTLSPELGREIDFFEKNRTRPLTIRGVFLLDDDERSSLIAAIEAERPQLRNALDALDTASRLSIKTQIKPGPDRYAFVQNVCLLKPEVDEVQSLLLDLSEEAGRCLFERATETSRARADKSALNRFLQRFDSDDFQTVRRASERPDRSGPPLDYFLRRPPNEQMSSRLTAEIRRTFQTAESYDQFIQSMTQLASSAETTAGTLSTSPLPVKIQTFSGDETEVPRYVQSLLQKISVTAVLHFRERRQPIGPDEAKRLLALKVKRGGTEVLRNIQARVNELLGVKVDAFEASTIRPGESSAELDVDDFLVQVNGSGIREALRLILDIEFAKPQVVLVEEPEIHLHPALETSTMKYLRDVSLGCQIFVTTHSTNFLDTGSFENVFLVSKPDSTHIQPLSLAEAEERLPAELGIRLSSLFMYDQIIFVEGPSDEQIIRELAAILNVNLAQLNVGFIPMRGIRNIGHYAAAEVIAFLTKRRVKLWFLVDQDEANSVHFTRLKDEFSGTATVHILSRREIENYLLSPAANSAHLRARKSAVPHDKSFPVLEPAQVLQEMEVCADNLKHLAIWKRIRAACCHPILPKERMTAAPKTLEEMKQFAASVVQQMGSDLKELQQNLDRISEQAVTEVEKEWGNRKMEIVPGSNILDDWYRRYGLRFDKIRDGPAIAALMKQDEIPRELGKFIRSVAGR
jgi:putative ATP-dependent endonuclease of the OLD family